MQISRINQFVEELKVLNTGYFDNARITALEGRFSAYPSHRTLTNDDFIFVESVFCERWKSCKFTSKDYTQDQQGQNAEWIKLAKEIAPERKKTYIEVLFPDIENKKDPIYDCDLHLTENTTNLFLGDNGKILYRKMGLCTYLINHDFNLLIKRGLISKSTSHITIGELARLSTSGGIPGNQISIGEQRFESFWDLLRKKAFPKLNPLNTIPSDILAEFVLLINQYFILQTNEIPFTAFKESFTKFLNNLYKKDSGLVNQFYGISFDVEINPHTDVKTRYFMLDFLTKIFLSETYNTPLESELKLLLTYVYTSINSKLQIHNQEFQTIYRNIIGHPVIRRHSDGSTSMREADYKDCMLMLLSLCNATFPYRFFNAKTINAWDTTNSVPSDLAGLYEKFEPVLKEGTIQQLISLYNSELRISIAPNAELEPAKGWGQSAYELLSSLMSSVIPNSKFDAESKKWCYYVHNRRISEIYHLDWFNPKLLLHALIRYPAQNTSSKGKINKFLDGLIHTMTQNKVTPLIQLRINILFSDLVRSIDPIESSLIKIWLSFYIDEDYTRHFFSNITNHVGNTLHRIYIRGKQTTLTLFTDVEHLNSKATFDFSNMNLTSAQDVVTTFSNEIQSDKYPMSHQLRRELITYLQGLQLPILSVEEESAVRLSVKETVDPVAAPT